jgi:hypothetical protein
VGNGKCGVYKNKGFAPNSKWNAGITTEEQRHRGHRGNAIFLNRDWRMSELLRWSRRPQIKYKNAELQESDLKFKNGLLDEVPRSWVFVFVSDSLVSLFQGILREGVLAVQYSCHRRH